MEKQQHFSKENLEKKIGKIYEVLIECTSFDKKFLIGRTISDAPDIDGLVYIKNTNIKKNIINSFIKCKIINVKNYDLIAEIVLQEEKVDRDFDKEDIVNKLRELRDKRDFELNSDTNKVLDVKYLGKLKDGRNIFLIIEQKLDEEGNKISIERYCTEDGEVLARE